MDFTLTNELLMLRKMYREFAENEIKPLAAEIDEEERFPKESIPKLARYGFLGIPFPKKYGGQGGTNLAYAMAIEELAKCCTTTATIVAAHTSLCCYPIYAYGTEEQKMKYLPDLLSGRKLGAFGLTEPNAGSDASGQQTMAVLEGDHYVLNGTKCFITNAGEAEIYVVMAIVLRIKEMQAAIAMVKFFTSPESQQLALEMQGMVPAAASVEITDTATTNFPLLGEFLNIASECTVRSNTFTGNMVPGLQDLFSAELPNLANGTYTPEQFCQILTDFAAANAVS